MMSIPTECVGGLGLLLSGPECMLIDKSCRCLKRMQKKEEDLSRVRTEVGLLPVLQQEEGLQRWILGASLLCSIQ